MRPLLSAVLLSALVACSSDVDAQLDDLADELAELAEENAALSSEIDELAAENAALAADLDALSQVEDNLTAPFVYFSQVYDYDAQSYTWTIHVDGEQITRTEAAVYNGLSTADGLLGENSGQECLTLQTSANGVLLAWVWQGDAVTCHSSYYVSEQCYPIWGSSSVDEC